MIYYCCKGINPIKISVSKLLFEEQKKDNDNIDTIKPFNVKAKSEKSHRSTKSKKKKQNKSTKDFNPPKKARVKRNNNNNSFERKKQKGDLKLVDIFNKRRRSIKNKQQKKDDESVKSDKVRKRKSIIDYQNEIVLKTRENLLNMEEQQLENKIENEKKVTFNPNGQIYKLKEVKLRNEKNKNKQEKYDNYEYNHMGYQDASKLDKRSCLRTYWSVLLREHYVIFTFISRNDYNLFYVKIERFFILICTEMTMNGMFFLHETMYRKKTGGVTFAQKLPQIIFSLIVTHIIEIILCFLGMTDVHYYEIKALPKLDKNDNKNNETIENFFKKDKRDKENVKKYQKEKSEKDNRIFNILDHMERKLIAFFVFTFLVFLFHWYFISAFCAVYQNTQKIFLRDSGISILTSLIDPFIIYGITCILRAISLTLCCRKKLSCIYKTSELIPIF